MLKIKDNVDLKELEKFGFVELKSSDGSKSLGWKWSTIIEDDGEEIEVEIYVYPDNNRKRRLLSIDYDVEDKLFDLIQAGLVEKVKRWKDCCYII